MIRRTGETIGYALNKSRIDKGGDRRDEPV